MTDDIQLVYYCVCVLDVWNHRTGRPMPLQALSAGTSLTLCGVTPVAAHRSMLEPYRLPHTTNTAKDTQTSKIRDI